MFALLRVSLQVWLFDGMCRPDLHTDTRYHLQPGQSEQLEADDVIHLFVYYFCLGRNRIGAVMGNWVVWLRANDRLFSPRVANLL